MTAIRSLSQQGNKGALGFNYHHGKAIPLMQMKLFFWLPNSRLPLLHEQKARPVSLKCKGMGGLAFFIFFLSITWTKARQYSPLLCSPNEQLLIPSPSPPHASLSVLLYLQTSISTRLHEKSQYDVFPPRRVFKCAH